MQLSDSKTVREIAIEVPGATRVFEKLGIDYCCGGAKPITEACQAIGVTVEQVEQSLEQLETSSQTSGESRDWQTDSLAALISHIENKHHLFTREALDGIESLIVKVCSVYGERYPELAQVRELVEELGPELRLHMKKEENILFPYIRQMETAVNASLPAPVPMFGTVRNPVRMMMTEHDAAGELLRKIRQLSNDFNPPADACVSYQTLYRRLEELEQDLHQHIHLENNILFPRAVEMEG
jgi:regulator of cell morphogenesis and NO signaling